MIVLDTFFSVGHTGNLQGMSNAGRDGADAISAIEMGDGNGKVGSSALKAVATDDRSDHRSPRATITVVISAIHLPAAGTG